MKTITVVETNFASSQIRKMKPILKDFGFEGGYLDFIIADKNLTKAKSILGKSILNIKAGV